MRRWLPHLHWGGSSGECVRDDDGGREGFYVAICWLGFMVDVTVSSVYRARRLYERIRADRGSDQ